MSVAEVHGDIVWTVRDFALYGTNATGDDVERAAHTTCSALGVEALLVLPLGPSVLFGSLAGWYFDDGDHRSLRDALPVSRRADELARHIQEGDPVKLSRALRDLGETTDGDPAGLPDLFRPVRQPTRVGLDVACLVWPGSGRCADDPRVDDLAATLACTLQVESRSVDEEIATVEGLVEDLSAEQAPRSVTAPVAWGEQMVPQLAKLALAATKSDWACIYYTDGPSRLRCLASIGDVHLPEELDRNSASAVTRAVYEPGTFVTGGIQAPRSRRLLPDQEGEKTPPPGVQLTVPIMDVGGGTEADGALVVGRIDRPDRMATAYSQYDAALARNVVLRVASLSHRDFTASVMHLASVADVQVGEERLRKGLFGRGESSDVAADHDLAIDWLAHIVDVLAAHPHVGSASIRLLSPDRKSLIRKAIAPGDRVEDDQAVVPVAHKGSVVALVARTGEPVYIPNLEKNQHLKDLGLMGVIKPQSRRNHGRRRSLSELCLPIVVEGRVVGTLNCESSRRDALVNVRRETAALASLAGHVLERTQHQLERFVLEFGSQLFAAAHTLAHVSDALKREEAPTRSFLLTQAESIRAALDQRSRARGGAQPSTGEPVDVVSLLDNVRKELSSGGQAVEWSYPPTPSGQLVEARVERAAYFALRELVHNAVRHSPKDEMGRSHATLRWDAPGPSDDGMGYFGIDVANRLRSHASVDIARLFRVPTGMETGRPHVGAFAAGVLLRSIGGDVWVADHTHDSILVRVSIPCMSAPQPQGGLP
jgi:GAF domain-containing protein